MKCELLEPKDPRWIQILSTSPHDVFHLPSYLEMEARRLRGQAVAAYVEADGASMLTPLVLRRAPIVPDDREFEVLDATSPYGYCHPIVPNGEAVPAETRSRLVAGTVGSLAAVGVASLFVRLHPLLPSDSGALRALGDVVVHGETVWIDLAESPETWWRQTRMSDRNRIHRLRRSGYAFRPDPRWSSLPEFIRIYHQTMTHAGASAEYHFDDRYFEELREALGGHAALLLVEHGRSVAAAAIVTESGGLVQFHLSGTDQQHRAAGPSRLLIDGGRSWARERGWTRFHLGGGVGARADSLFKFKCGFSEHRASFATWRAIPRPDLYAAAIERWRRLNPTESVEINGYFPRYRGASLGSAAER